ncbi:transglutaminase [Actinomadura rubrisoli]|uniref:Transglutaminase n=2 Tax=Actinomadura rubrisoli TaxID=2530368 RepID=A0A4R5BVG6_9ACTN|nr:transglutaminase [Actinomadura rubrisoli]
MTITAGLATLASSVGLYPLFESGRWFWAALGSVLAVAGGGLLVRRFRLPAVVNPLGGLAALLVYLTVVYAPGQALLWCVPSPASLRHLADLAGDGWDSANRYAAPVPLVPGIALLAAAGVGIVAVLVDLLAVRLRRAAPAGLPLLAMYSVPAAVRDDSVSWLAFGVGALGYLALLMSDSREQVGGWGRTVTTRRTSDEVPMAGAEAPPEEVPARPDASALAASGRRIGVGAVAVAVLLPMAVPGIQPRGLFGMGGRSGHGTQTVTTPDPLVSLKRELTRTDESVVLTYRTNDPAGPDYLRLYALDRFDGDRWTYSALQSSSKDRLTERAIPPPPGLEGAPTHEVTTTVKVNSKVKNMTFLPVPYAPAEVMIKGDWRVHPQSLMVYSLRDSAGGRAYTVRSLRAQPTGSGLSAARYYPADIVSRYTSVPKNVPPEVRKLAQQITGGSTTAHAQAVRLQTWFTQTGGFAYDLSAPAPQHGSDLVDFLLHSKRGYCEQFAAAMALLARIVGIPSRVAMGYTPGSETGRGEWTVRSRDAHAWPELYFEGAGWVRFEPTPSGTAGQGTATTPIYSQPAVPGSGRTDSSTDPSPSTSSTPDDSSSSSGARPRHRLDDEGPEGAPVGKDDDGNRFAATPWLAGGLLTLLLLAVPMALRAFSRRRRWAALASAPAAKRPAPAAPGPDPASAAPGGPALDSTYAAHAAWREMRADALDHGLQWSSSDSPRAAARHLGELLELDDAGTEALTRIARAEELARYSRSRPTERPERLRADVRTVREAFAQSVGRRARWRARLLPPSTLAQVTATLRTAGTHAAEAADRLNELPARIRRRP